LGGVRNIYVQIAITAAAYEKALCAAAAYQLASPALFTKLSRHWCLLGFRGLMKLSRSKPVVCAASMGRQK
jgi:hypothetical protein